MAQRRTRLEIARERAEIARLQAQTSQDKLDATLSGRAHERIVALHSRIDPADPNNTRRRTAKVETKPEDRQQTARDRGKAANVGRELHRTSSRYRLFENQFAVNVIGTGPKVVFHWKDKDAASLAADWFNQTYAPTCDGRDDNHLADFAELVLHAVPRDGEVLAVFDDFDFNDGTLLFFESDQLPTLNPLQWRQFALDPINKTLFVELERAKGADGTRQPMRTPDGEMIPLRLESGRVTNRYGKVVWYIGDEQHGRSDVDPNDPQVRFFSRRQARLIKRPWRFNQLIGTSEVLALSGDLEDLDAMRSAEIASARKNSQRAYAVKGRNAYENALARQGVEVDSLLDNAEDDPAAGDQEAGNLDALEKFADGHVDYIGEDEDILELGKERPNVNVNTFDDDVATTAGGALGLARVFSTMKASTSYTAFRGEQLMTWGTFARCQKWLERRLLDWVCTKAVGWAVSTGRLKVSLPAVWENTFSWIMPEMPEVNQVLTVTAKAKQLKNGLTDYAKLLGPNWEKILRAFGEQMNIIRDVLPELEMLETKAGAPIESTAGNETLPDGDTGS